MTDQRMRRILRRAAVGVVLAAGVVAFGAQAASAHDTLVGTTPSADESVSTVTEVSQTFNANLIEAGEGNFAEVTGSDGLHYESGCSAVAGPTITTPVALGAAGTYQVAWRAVSSDGHPIAGEYTFEYAPAAGAVAAEGQAGSACSAEEGTMTTQGDADTDADAASDAADTPSGIDGLALGLGIGGAAIVIVGIAVIVILRSPRD